MKTILLPTDFSKNSMNAIDYAMELFENERCDFYILNVQKVSSFISDDMMMVSSSATIYNTIIDASKKSISNIISNIQKRYKNEKHHFHSVVDYDNFIDSIDQVCKIHQVDLIVMGTKGASGLEKVFFGSNTVHVIQHCSVPVLVIPNGYKYKKLSKAAFTTNHLELHSLEEMLILRDLKTIYNFELDVLHIIDDNHPTQDDFDNEQFFKTHFRDANHQYLKINNKDIFEVVHNYIIDNDVNLFAMMNKKHSFLERLFNRQMVEVFGFKIDIPFLVINIDEVD